MVFLIFCFYYTEMIKIRNMALKGWEVFSPKGLSGFLPTGRREEKRLRCLRRSAVK
jgi:hypothetical protein